MNQPLLLLTFKPNMSSKIPPPSTGIDLISAVVGERFLLRDGTPVEYVGQGPPREGNRLFKFKTLNIDPPHDCFRARDGRFSQGPGVDPRDIVGKAPPVTIDLTNADVGQFFKRRNGTDVWVQQIKGPETEFRWTVGLIPYRVDGTHLISGEISPLDLVEALGFRTEKPAPTYLDMTQYPLGQLFKRRDGNEVRFTSNTGKMEKWPYIVGGDTYSVEGRFMSLTQDSPKDLISAVVMQPKAAAMNADDAFEALRRIAEQQDAKVCKRITALVDFLEREMILNSK